jgi:hypothetical protein
MPWLPFYASAGDFDALLQHLNSTDDIAFLVAAGPHRWVAKNTLESLQSGRICLWHTSSGPLPLLQPGDQKDLEVANPFEAWTELRTGADPSTPYFGAGHPGVFWLNLRGDGMSRQGAPIVALSSFEWIGNHYKIIGDAALPQTEAAWKALRRWIGKIAKKVPRGGPAQPTPPEIWAFPHAQQLFADGVHGGNN